MPTPDPQLTPAELEALTAGEREIAERAAKATPGPWEVTHNAIHEETRVYAGSHERAFLDGRLLLREQTDGEFIAHARTDIPALLRTVAGLRRALKPFADLVANYPKAAAWVRSTGLKCSDELPPTVPVKRDTVLHAAALAAPSPATDATVVGNNWQCPKCKRWNFGNQTRCRSEFDTGIPCDGLKVDSPSPATRDGKDGNE